MALSTVLFYILAVLTGFCAIGVVVTQNIVRAAAWLLFALAGTAGVFFLLGADFVGATQLLVYVGGTLVLVVFGVMLTAQGPFISMRIGAAEWVIALAVGLLLYGVLVVSLWRLEPPVVGEPAADHPPNLTPSIYLGASLLGDQYATPAADVTGVPRQMTGPVAQASALGLLGTAQGQGPLLAATTLAAGRSPVVERPRERMAYLLPFEIVSVHLLVVLIGAAYLARAKRRRGVSP